MKIGTVEFESFPHSLSLQEVCKMNGVDLNTPMGRAVRLEWLIKGKMDWQSAIIVNPKSKRCGQRHCEPGSALQ